MPTYAYRCAPGCGAEFDLFRPIAARDEPVDCACGLSHSEKEGERLKARVFLPTTPDQFLTPGHFGTTLPSTGMKIDGKSGEWENLSRSFNRWDSGATGRRPYEKRLARAAQRG